MSSQSSIYDSLPVDSKSIRVLTILPDNDPFTELRCGLKRIELLDSLGCPLIEAPFEALSYCWAEPDFSCSIICNGFEIKVTSNLFDALRHMRQFKQERTIWIDALCINQADAREKAIQVPLMKHIYEHAKKVMMWLGPQNTSTAQALELIFLARDHFRREAGIAPIPFISHKANLLIVMLKRIARQRLGFSGDIAHEAFDDARSVARGFPSWKDTEKWEPLVELLSRKWFSRCWIKQESALASLAIMQAGAHLFSWLDLCHAIDFFLWKGYFGSKIPGLSPVLMNVRALCKWSRTGLRLRREERTLVPLIILLEETRTLNATVPVDKVYALMGLAEEPGQITVDYSMSVKDLYTQVTRVLLEPPLRAWPVTYPLQVLASVNQYSTFSIRGQQKQREFRESVPSWVVNWDNLTEDNSAEIEQENWPRVAPMFRISAVAKFCSGGKEYPGPVDDRQTPYEISLRGFFFAEVSTCVSICRLPALSRSQLWDFVLEIWSMQQDKHMPYPTGESMDEAFAKTLTMSDPDPASRTAGDTYHGIDFQHFCVAMYEQTISILTNQGRTADIESLSKEWEVEYLRLKSLVGSHIKSDTFSRDMQRNCGGRMLFSTKNGHIGIGDNALAPGDIVCVFLGGRTPHVLRPVEDGKYKFIGECYLHGIMYGEALKEGLIREKQFTLI